ncbi:hypothetical protein KKG31_07275 [Patescibacteria group bacterium]|nr:hypothetical protein [Patescibacteria group bacterium]MBU1758879.1 hypothetical protein [Patescibacteria group bacterium]
MSEIKHKIKTGNMSDKAKQLIKNIIKNPIFKWVSLIMMISIIGYYIYNYRMKPYYDQKALDEYNEKVRNQNVQDSIAYEKARIQAIGDSIAFAKQKEEEEIRKVKAAEEERKREEADEIDKTTFSLQEAQDNIPQ